MAKQCSECGAITESDVTPYCESCGGRAWKIPASAEVAVWRTVYITAAIAVLIAAVYWLVIRQR